MHRTQHDWMTTYLLAELWRHEVAHREGAKLLSSQSRDDDARVALEGVEDGASHRIAWLELELRDSKRRRRGKGGLFASALQLVPRFSERAALAILAWTLGRQIRRLWNALKMVNGTAYALITWRLLPTCTRARTKVRRYLAGARRRAATSTKVRVDRWTARRQARL